MLKKLILAQLEFFIYLFMAKLHKILDTTNDAEDLFFV